MSISVIIDGNHPLTKGMRQHSAISVVFVRPAAVWHRTTFWQCNGGSKVLSKEIHLHKHIWERHLRSAAVWRKISLRHTKMVRKSR